MEKIYIILFILNVILGYFKLRIFLKIIFKNQYYTELNFYYIIFLNFYNIVNKIILLILKNNKLKILIFLYKFILKLYNLQ
jgi:hypothetical protein